MKKRFPFFSVSAKKRDVVFSGVVLFFCVVLYFIPTGFEGRLPREIEHTEGQVVSVDNSHMEQHGLILSGSQGVDVMLLTGRWKGQTVRTGNHFLGKMELDRVFVPGERVLMNLASLGDVITWAQAADHYRLKVELLLLVVFALFLLFYGGFIGFQSIMSFIFTGLVLWKVMIPYMLKGVEPIFLSFGIAGILSAVVLYLVGGLGRKATVAFLGAIAGLGVTAVMALFFTGRFRVSGAVLPFSETLLYSGYAHLNLTRIFIASVVLSASGAVTDLAMDISAAMSEIVRHNPSISRRELFFSGNNIGKAVIGTMTTTLLLAYSGGYIAMLMLFMGQGLPELNILNMNYVAAEILHTVVGSFGLVLVAPLTTIMGALLYVSPKEKTLNEA